MVHFEDLSPTDFAKYGRSCDRFLAFDSILELDLLTKAAIARKAWRLKGQNTPFKMDDNFSKLPFTFPSGIPVDVEGVESTRELLECFAEAAYTFSRHWDPMRQETDRERARNLSAAILEASRFFDEVQALTSENPLPGSE